MQNLLNLEKVSKAFENRTLLRQVTVGISDGDKIGIIGVNGTGKSTLLSIAAGILEPDEGRVTRARGIRITYLPQKPEFDDAISVLDNVVRMAAGHHQGWDAVGEVKAMLARLGITDPEQKPSQLSGGQRKRAALAAVILTSSDLLILDEPTNHLDSEMIEWLQDFLIHFRGAILMVTHDRYFLDQVTNQILEIDHGACYRYAENYSGYLFRKEERLNAAVAAERKMAALYRKDLAWIQRGARARSTKQKAHIARFEELRDRDRLIEERRVEMDSLQSRLGGKTIELANVSKAYGEKLLFRNFSYIFLKNDRIGIIGPNGCGKSTLMKVIIGQEEPDEGRVDIGQTVKIGYFGQENVMPEGGQRVIDYVREIAEYLPTSEGLTSASAMCERFLFDSNMQYTPVSRLSGGEKRRLYLLRVLMSAPNVLILDEPTNDLDIQTLRILEDYLDRFAGIVITVSHDRYFLDRVVTRIFSFEDGGILEQHEGGYEEYRIRKLAEAEKEALSGKTASVEDVSEIPDGKKRTACPEDNISAGEKKTAPAEDMRRRRKKTRLSFKEQKEYDGIEAEINDLQNRSDEIDREILQASADFVRLQALSEEKADVEARLEARMERYLELDELVKAIEAGEVWE